MRSVTLRKASYLLVGAALLNTVSCLPTGDQIRGIVQSSVLTGISSGLSFAADLLFGQIFPVAPADTTATTGA